MALHITVRYGDFIEVKHGEERLLVSVHKRSGTEARVSLQGPKSFKIRNRKGETPTEEIRPKKVKCGAI